MFIRLSTVANFNWKRDKEREIRIEGKRQGELDGNIDWRWMHRIIQRGNQIELNNWDKQRQL